ncbi:DUF4262 domain-containing protein [Subtercola endophyticus]|uniref:DUF4262 domain-containing protein n=1 Tax=Subtercola endophyticus TaxID=2895559 RepID=UPI001E4ED14B|nr:DUF4262 domain-containing protein [Subtercola endophyticus]UFS58964.1 DUF4262 domain-containing protein [Subtercola endophyticus]
MASHPGGRNEYRDMVRSIVDQHGWFVQKVFAGEGSEIWPQFAYTVGLTEMGHPEMLCHGLPLDTAHRLLNVLGEQVRAGTRFPANSAATTLTADNLLLFFIEVTNRSDLAVATMMYGEVEAVQLIWPDKQKRFPWNEGCSIPSDQQPLRGRLPGPRVIE